MLVGTHHPMRDVLQAAVGADAHTRRQAHASDGALGQARIFDLIVGHQREARAISAVFGLQLVELVVARQEQHHGGSFFVHARHSLDGGRFGNAQELRQVGDGGNTGRLDLLQLRFGTFGRMRRAGRHFRVGGESA